MMARRGMKFAAPPTTGKNMDITLTLTLEEAVALTNLVGSLPTAQGAYPLFQKLKSQVEPHLPNEKEAKQ